MCTARGCTMFCDAVEGTVRSLTLDANAAVPGDVLRRMHTNELHAVWVKGLFTPTEVASVLERIASGAHTLPLNDRDHAAKDRAQIRVLGEPVSPSDLHPAGPDAARYFASAIAFQPVWPSLFAPAPPFHERMAALFARLAEGCAVHTAERDGLRYGVATARCIPPGCGLPPHCEADYMRIPIYDGLRERVALERKIGFFMPLATPEAGGEIVVYAKPWTGPSGADRAAALADVPHAAFAPAPGDAMLLNSGSMFHAVRTVEGSRPRWTIGGFGAFTRDGAAFLHWA